MSLRWCDMNHQRAFCLVAVLLGELTDLAAAASSPATSASQEMSADEIARELANPNTALARLTLKSQWTNWGGGLRGADGRDSGTFLFQPGFPFPVGERRNVFFRPAFSYSVNHPVADSSTGRVESRSGFADIGYDLAYGYATKSGWQTVVGMVGSLPTGTRDLSSDTWTLGPEFAVAKIGKPERMIGFNIFPVVPNIFAKSLGISK